MAKCKVCEGQYSDKRAQLGYRTCLSCGEREAQEDINAKRQRQMPIGNKMGYGYIGGSNMQETREIVLGLTGKGKVRE